MNLRVSETRLELESVSETRLDESEIPLLTDSQSSENLAPLLMDLEELIRPAPKRTASEWADDNRVLPPGSAEPGKWRTSRVPWVGQIHIRIRHHNARMSTVVMGSQMSKTDGVCLNYVGWRLDDDPVPILYIGPTKSNVDSVIEPRVSLMFSQSESLKRRLSKDKKRSKKLVKRIGHVTLRLAWAGSATELASQPACIVVIDEIDRMPPIPGEGDVVGLAGARTDTYSDSLILLNSTPTLGSVDVELDPVSGIEIWKKAENEDVPSPVWSYWQQGTMHVWIVPCMHCGKYFMPRHALLVYPGNLAPSAAAKKAGLQCPDAQCGRINYESHKQEMNCRGVFIRKGERVEDVLQGKYLDGDVEHISFWISGLMSPWVSFTKSAYKWLMALDSGKSERLQSTMNTRFGELYKIKGVAPPWEAIRAKSDGHKKFEIPDWVQRIYLTVDVQQDRLVLNCRGWGHGYMSRLIFKDEIWSPTGKTDDPDLWAKLKKIIEEGFAGREYDAVAIDSGYETQRVYTFCSELGNPNVIPTRGDDAPRKLFQPFDAEVDRNGKKVKIGLKYWRIDSPYFKSWIHDRINWPNDKPGGWYVYENVEESYCREVVAEQKMVMDSGKVRWIRVSRDNHQLDCEVLQVFLAHMGDVRYLEEPGVVSSRPTYSDLAKRLNGD